MLAFCQGAVTLPIAPVRTKCSPRPGFTDGGIPPSSPRHAAELIHP